MIFLQHVEVEGAGLIAWRQGLDGDADVPFSLRARRGSSQVFRPAAELAPLEILPVEVLR